MVAVMLTRFVPGLTPHITLLATCGRLPANYVRSTEYCGRPLLLPICSVLANLYTAILL